MDELSRLGTAFNTMLGALEDAIETQRRFVADASHELRTPLTSMQTNIEVLKQQERLDAGARSDSSTTSQREAHEMRDLIGGLLELARGDDPSLGADDVPLRRARRRASSTAHAAASRQRFEVELEPTTLTGCARAARARRLEPARERGQVERTRVDGRGHARRRRAARPRSRARHRRGGPRARLRPLLPFSGRAVAARFGARARDRARGGGVARRHRCRRGCARRRRDAHASPSEVLDRPHLAVIPWNHPPSTRFAHVRRLLISFPCSRRRRAPPGLAATRQNADQFRPLTRVLECRLREATAWDSPAPGPGRVLSCRSRRSRPKRRAE